jgi:hypothetical protein
VSEPPPEESKQPPPLGVVGIVMLVLLAAIPIGAVIGLHQTAPYSLVWGDDVPMGWLEAIATTIVSLGCLVGTIALALRVNPLWLLVVAGAVAYAIWLSHDSGLPWIASIVIAPIVAVIVLVVIAVIVALIGIG